MEIESGFRALLEQLSLFVEIESSFTLLLKLLLEGGFGMHVEMGSGPAQDILGLKAIIFK